MTLVLKLNSTKLEIKTKYYDFSLNNIVPNSKNITRNRYLNLSAII